MEVKHFVDLKAWQKNHKLVLEVYKIINNFPDNEKFGLISQISRAVCSITGNIAEGFGRYHYNDKIKFYLISRGSSAEVQNYLIIARDLNYISKEDFNRIKLLSYEGYLLICGLIKSIENFKNN